MRIRVSELMNSSLLFLQCGQSIGEAARLFVENENIAALPVVDDEHQLLGFLSKKQLLVALAGGISSQDGIGSLLNREFKSLSSHDYLPLIIEEKFEYIPVINGGELVGMLYYEEVYHAIAERLYAQQLDMEASIDAVYNPVISIDNEYRIEIFNKAAAKLMGMSAQEVRGSDARKIFHGTGLLDSLLSGSPAPLPANKLLIGGRSFLPYRTDVSRDGRTIGAILVLREISEFEELVKESEYTKKLNRELDAIIESSFDGLFVTDGQANILMLNQGFERITGVMANECIGRNMADLVKEGIFSRSGTLLALEKGEPVTISIVPRSGKEVLITSNPIFDEQGNIIMVVTNVRDITELNELQRRLQQVEGLRQLYKSELQQLKMQNSQKMVVKSNKMKELLNMVTRVAGVDSTVLIQGESGVGKELIAEIIHQSSNRREGPFIKVNCGAIPENLLESELFGYEEGAFTGARKSGKIGLFELANNGILFLDEIGELPLGLQVKLLRVLQNKEISRIGGSKSFKVDTRIVAGTNQDLMGMIEQQKFRLDLYYRLNVIPITVPPLRERMEDIPVLANHFLEIFNQKYRMNKRFQKDVIDCFMEYHWPGNVRELENLTERLMVTSNDRIIKTTDLPGHINKLRQKNDNDKALCSLRQTVENAERQLLEKAFKRYKTTYQIAQALGINQSTVVRKAAKYGIKTRN
ncbi:MAG: sigma 54-interacting transcriptional regulator [Syntrophomonadaceae bacterium]|jgi:PAS domain S-box-containing protein|nr:sigma 54-interacting transcriptional regulator [Syntrophomonadaceae bacterium]